MIKNYYYYSIIIMNIIIIITTTITWFFSPFMFVLLTCARIHGVATKSLEKSVLSYKEKLNKNLIIVLKLN